MSEKIKNMFDSIASKYDLMNGILSAGVHRSWRRKAVREAAPVNGERILDLATGTGDLAFEFEKRCPGCTIKGVDFSKRMLTIADKKKKKKSSKVNFSFADAMDLPFEDSAFDICTIAYGIRNVDDPVEALKEMKRVTKKGGKIIILEFGDNTGFAKMLNRIAFKVIMPAAGAIFAGNSRAYSYLQESSAKFPGGNEFLKLMNDAGIQIAAYEKLTGGISYLYKGIIDK